MNRILILPLLLMSLLSAKGWSQDATFSQFYNNKLRFNPAYAGVAPGIRANVNYRNQWRNIPGLMNNTNFTLDIGIPKIGGIGGGLGLMFNQDTEGEGMLKTQELALAGSIRMRTWDWGSYSSFVFVGGQVSRFSQRIDWDKLVFTNQLDPIYGKLNASGVPQPTFMPREYYDTSVGMFMWFQKTGKKQGARLHEYDKSRSPAITVGVAAKHLLRPNESFWQRRDGFDETLPIRLSAHAMSLVPLPHSNISLIPAILFEKQASIETFSLGLLGMFDVMHVKRSSQRTDYAKTTQLFGGLLTRTNFRNTDALIINLGFRWFWKTRVQRKNWNGSPHNTYKQNSLRVGYSYDLTAPSSGLSGSTGGSHEISLIITWGGKEKVRCPKSHQTFYSTFQKRRRMMVLY